jgi:protocadherin alpha
LLYFTIGSIIEDNETLIDSLGRSDCTLEHDLKKCTNKPGCGYCVKKDYEEIYRCETFHKLNATNCGKDIFEPIDENHETTFEPNKTNDPISIHFLPGTSRNITIFFSLLPHPIDLYYLMDFSGSMSDDKKNLVILAAKLKNSIGNITEDYELGLGSFVDKPIAPFGGDGE